MSTGIAYFYNSIPDLVNNPPVVSQGIVVKKPFFSENDSVMNSFMISLKTEKNGKIIQPMFGLSYANLFSIHHVQISTGLSYFPFSNYRFYGKTNLYTLLKGRGMGNPQFTFHQ